MILLVGLGNPGAKYALNRHNIGFMAVDAIVRRHSFSDWRSRFQGMLSEGSFGPIRALALKPQTYMNESGRSVGEAMRFYKLTPADIIVFHDELDLPSGKLRIKTGGGAGGHNGLRSIDAHIGQDYRRVRLGIAHPGGKDRVLNHVLGDFAKSDAAWIDPLRDAIAEFAPLLATGKDSSFANKVHLTLTPEEPKPDAKKDKPAKDQNGDG
jgi:PTH1 family peptidyl-tRNA hydrolase